MLMKFILLSSLMEMMTCLCNGPFVVKLIQGLGFEVLFLLMIFWMLLILLASNNRKASFIFKTSLVLPMGLVTYAYEVTLALILVVDFVGMKYLEISFTFFGNLARIGEIFLILVGLSVLFSLFLPFFSKLTLGVNLKATFYLKLLL